MGYYYFFTYLGFAGVRGGWLWDKNILKAPLDWYSRDCGVKVPGPKSKK